jgi:hypothetical protein
VGNQNERMDIELLFFLIPMAWLALIFVAYFVAPDDRRLTFSLLTALVAGPLGVLAAAVAQPRSRPLTVGRSRQVCGVCGAESHIPETAAEYTCWQCSKKWRVAAQAPSVQKPKAVAPSKD